MKVITLPPPGSHGRGKICKTKDTLKKSFLYFYTFEKQIFCKIIMPWSPLPKLWNTWLLGQGFRPNSGTNLAIQWKCIKSKNDILLYFRIYLRKTKCMVFEILFFQIFQYFEIYDPLVSCSGLRVEFNMVT